MIKYKNKLYSHAYAINGIHVNCTVIPVDAIACKNDIKLLNIFFDKNKNLSYKHGIMHLRLRIGRFNNICCSPFFYACK